MRRTLVAMAVMAQSTLASASGPPSVEVRDLAPGARHTYPFTAQAGQLVTARLEPLAGQMDLRVVGPDGRVLGEARNLSFQYNRRLSRRITRAGRGRIEVSSAQGGRVRYVSQTRGACFRVELPRAASGPLPATNSA